jgi:hypothetical protein
MRNPVGKLIVAVLAVTSLASMLQAQEAGRGGGRRPPEGFIAEGIPKMPNPPGPAPKQDLSGAWVGPQQAKLGAVPPMTPAGEKLFKQALPYRAAADEKGNMLPSNDPFMKCDPLGFPRDLFAHAVSSRGGTLFGSAPGRILIAYQQQRFFREVWMDGRALPAKVDVKGAPESKFYGFSVGHWENDNTLVIDTTGLDERAWLDEAGHPKSNAAKIQERYVRTDQYNMTLTVTVDDAKYYTKPFTLLTANFYWMKDQEFEENICVPSEAIDYLETLAKPSGIKEAK